MHFHQIEILIILVRRLVENAELRWTKFRGLARWDPQITDNTLPPKYKERKFLIWRPAYSICTRFLFIKDRDVLHLGEQFRTSCYEGPQVVTLCENFMRAWITWIIGSTHVVQVLGTKGQRIEQIGSWNYTLMALMDQRRDRIPRWWLRLSNGATGTPCGGHGRLEARTV